MTELANETLRVGEVLYEVDGEQRRHQSTWPDGKTLKGVWRCEEEDVARARGLGYTGSDEEACSAMHREHDLAHHVVAVAMGYESSPLLRRVAEGREKHPPGLGQFEERLAFLVQRVSNVGLETVARG